MHGLKSLEWIILFIIFELRDWLIAQYHINQLKQKQQFAEISAIFSKLLNKEQASWLWKWQMQVHWSCEVSINKDFKECRRSQVYLTFDSTYHYHALNKPYDNVESWILLYLWCIKSLKVDNNFFAWYPVVDYNITHLIFDPQILMQLLFR